MQSSEFSSRTEAVLAYVFGLPEPVVGIGAVILYVAVVWLILRVASYFRSTTGG